MQQQKNSKKSDKNKSNFKNTKIILFICKANSGRSQMAEAFFNYFSKKHKAISAGIDPDEKIHPWTIKVMEELGIDMFGHKPKVLTDNLMKKADKIVILDHRVPRFVPLKYFKKTEKWKVGRLTKKPIGKVRIVRDRIKKRVEKLIKEIG